MRIRAVPFCSLDVAVGVDPAGFDAWNEQEAILRDFSIGAPPDGFNPGGQNWGLVLELSARAGSWLASAANGIAFNQARLCCYGFRISN